MLIGPGAAERDPDLWNSGAYYGKLYRFPCPGGWKKSCAENDGMINTELTKAPFTGGSHKAETWHGDTGLKPGVWYNMPLLPVEHLGVVGYYLPITETADMRKVFMEQYRRVQNLR